MSLATKNIFIVGAKRTAFGAFGGRLKDMSATDLAVVSSKAAVAHAKIAPEKIDQSIFGNVIASSLDAAYLARHVALRSGMGFGTPALTVNRLCGSGFESVCIGAEQIILGNAKVVLAGGTESMSQAPYHIPGAARFGNALGKDLVAKDALWAGLSDSYVKLPMGLTAEKLGEKYGITRDDCDKYALRSQHTYQEALKAGVYQHEITPIEISGKKGKEQFVNDEHPRANATLPDMQKLKPVFKPEGGLVTAASASGICDGAASLVVTGDAGVKEHSLKPLTRVVAWHRVGCDPSIMGIGPVEAIRGVLKASSLTLDKIDIVEINEAFAAQYLACEKELGLDRAKVNKNGGAIALGHPLGASGARILTHLTHELIRTQKKYAIGAACIGGGQGIAVLLENVSK